MLQISCDMPLVIFFQYHEYQVCFSDLLLWKGWKFFVVGWPKEIVFMNCWMVSLAWLYQSQNGISIDKDKLLSFYQKANFSKLAAADRKWDEMAATMKGDDYFLCDVIKVKKLNVYEGGVSIEHYQE